MQLLKTRQRKRVIILAVLSLLQVEMCQLLLEKSSLKWLDRVHQNPTKTSKPKITKHILLIQRFRNNKIRPGGIKFSNKNKAANEGVVRASSGSNRHQHSKEGEDQMNSTWLK